MKRVFFLYTILALALVMGMVSCEEFTTVGTPQSQLTAPAVFENETTATAAITDVYAQIRELGMVNGNLGGLSHLMGVYADELKFYGTNTNIAQFDNHTIVATNPMLLSFWNAGYTQIYATNAIIEGLNDATGLTQADNDKLRGEALFLRAYLHFYLVNTFGDIPYATTTNYTVNTTIAKLPQTVIWQKIIADLTEAENLLPTAYPTAERVRANKAVATAMLARVYLYTANWQMAKTKATELINNPVYAMESNLGNAFLRTSPDIIWALQAGVAGVNTKDARTFVFNAGPPTRSALTTGLMNAFEPGDQRRVNWVKTVSNSNGTWYCPFKYKKTTNTGTSQEYTILLRLEELYLIRAEANAQLGNTTAAQTDINLIRNRAGLANTTANTTQSLLAAIARERQVELFSEQGHRWFDLKRTGKATEVLAPLKPNWADTQVVFPIPQTELLLNPNLLPQNNGY